MNTSEKYKMTDLDILWQMFSDDLDRIELTGKKPYDDPLFLKRLLVSTTDHLRALAVHSKPSDFKEETVWKLYDLVERGCEERPTKARSDREKIALGLFLRVLVDFGCPKIEACNEIHDWISPERIKATNRKYDAIEGYYQFYLENVDPITASFEQYYTPIPDWPKDIWKYSLCPLFNKFGPFQPKSFKVLEAYQRFKEMADSNQL